LGCRAVFLVARFTQGEATSLHFITVRFQLFKYIFVLSSIVIARLDSSPSTFNG
jgi:hypothetical protein